MISTIAASTIVPLSVSIGFNPISTGNSRSPFETVEIATGPDQTRARIGKKCLPQRRMMTTEPFGDEHLHRLSYQVGPRVSKSALGWGVYRDNPARPIDHHHSVRGSFDDTCRSCARRPIHL